MAGSSRSSNIITNRFMLPRKGINNSRKGCSISQYTFIGQIKIQFGLSYQTAVIIICSSLTCEFHVRLRYSKKPVYTPWELVFSIRSSTISLPLIRFLPRSNHCILQEMLTEASAVLNEGLERRVYFAQITLVLPSYWRDARCHMSVPYPASGVAYQVAF